LRVIAVANQKGGCGKTTTSINFAASLAFLQKKVLLIDLDPQGHSTCGLGVEVGKDSNTLYDLLTPKRESLSPIFNFFHEIEENLFLIPTHGNLSLIEEELAGFSDREKQLKDLLEKIELGGRNFDYVVLDCPPNLGVLTFNALEAADEIIIPIEPSFFSLHGLAKISETLAQVNQHRNQAIEIHALLTLFDSRTHFAQEVYEEVKIHFDEKLFKAIIHEDVLLKEAAGSGQSIVQYDQDSQAFRDYFNLAIEYLERQLDRMLPPQKLGWDRVVENHFGPRRVLGGVLFQALSRNARWVEIAGDFNNWVPEPLARRTDEGLWQKIIPISNGKYRYKFIVDGEWQIDPFQPHQQLNAYGTMDSFLEIA